MKIGVAVPIVLSQCISLSLHNHVFCGISPQEVGLDIALANAVYTKDRADSSSSLFTNMTTSGSMIGAMTYLATDVWTLPLVPIVPFLHYEYINFKKYISNVKPFVVAFFWTLTSTAQPFLIRHDIHAICDWPLTLSFFLSFTAISNAADMKDISEDMNKGIITPAVILGEDKSKSLTFLLLFMSILVHNSLDYTTKLDTIYDLSILSFIVIVMESPSKSLVVLFVSYFYLNTHNNIHNDGIIWVQFMSNILKSSEEPHKLAVNLVPWVIEHTEGLPEKLRNFYISIALDTLPIGDNMGSQFLKYYDNIIRETYNIKK
jgi:hypothetical protein